MGAPARTETNGSRWFVALNLGLLRLFYPRLETSDAGHRPARGPCIVVANHPNGLLDPLVVRVALGVPVRFLGKSTFWRNPLGRYAMEAFGAIPVYRAHEADTRQNEETFERCRRLLREGGWLALFPEGKSHDEAQVLPLKSGAARIALGARREGAEGLTILPVGLLYDDKAVFRSRAGVRVGEPIPVPVAGPEDREAVEALTARIAEGLGSVVLQAENEELWRGILAVAAWTDPSDRDAHALRLAAEARRLAAEAPERLDEAAAATRRFVRLMRVLGVEDPFTVDPRPPLRDLVGLAPLVLLAPVALVGAALAWLPYRIVRPVANRLSRGHADLVGTIKLLLGLLVLVPVYLGWAVVVGAALGPLAGLAMTVLGPLTGLGALRFDEILCRRREALRGWLLATDPRVTSAVQAHRAELCRLVEDALNPSATSPPPPSPAPRPAPG